VGSDELAALAARNAATAPPFSAATLEKLAVLLGPVATEVRRRSRRVRAQPRRE